MVVSLMMEMFPTEVVEVSRMLKLVSTTEVIGEGITQQPPGYSVITKAESVSMPNDIFLGKRPYGILVLLIIVPLELTLMKVVESA